MPKFPGSPLGIGKHLRAARERAGLTQHDVERLTGLAKSSLSRWENDHQGPMLYSALVLANAYQVSLSQLLGHPGGSEYAQGHRDGWEACRQAARTHAHRRVLQSEGA